MNKGLCEKNWTAAGDLRGQPEEKDALLLRPGLAAALKEARVERPRKLFNRGADTQRGSAREARLAGGDRRARGGSHEARSGYLKG
jgi:hypothetical protein